MRHRKDYKRASLLFEESLALCLDINDKVHLEFVQVELAQVARAQGDLQRAESYYRQSLTTSVEIGQGLLSFHSLIVAGFGGLARMRGDTEQAARLLGAASFVFEGAPRWLSVNRPSFENDVAAVRAQLDPEAFAAAWDEGRAMTVAQALALVI